MLWRFLVIVCLSCPSTLAAAPPVEILRASAGRDGFVRVILRVEPHEGTRRVCLVWYPEELEDFPSSSCQNVEGVDAPVIYTHERTLPHGGIWYFKGVVERNTGRVVSAPKAVIVGGP